MKKLFTIAALMLASLTLNATTNQFLAQLNENGGCFNFKSEKVCDRFDASDGDHECFILVYHDPSINFEYEELVVSKALYNEWCNAAVENRIVRVDISWDLNAHCFRMCPWTYLTWESEQEILYPEM